MDKENIISTSNFKIEENTISFNDSLVQISNIAHIDVVPVPKPKLFQPWSVVVGVIGMLVMFFESGGKIQLLGVLLTLFAVIHNIFPYKYISTFRSHLYGTGISMQYVINFSCPCGRLLFFEFVLRHLTHCIIGVFYVVLTASAYSILPSIAGGLGFSFNFISK